MQEKNAPIVTFAERFSKLLENSGMSQQEIAKATMLSRTAIVHYKTGRSIPGGNELYRIAKFFGCSMEWLIAGEENSQTPPNVKTWIERTESAEKKVEDLKASIMKAVKKF